jgi:uncharacterized membrane protein
VSELAAAVRPPIRSARERLIQTLWFEGIGLAIVAPLYGWVAGMGLGDSFGLIASVSIVVMAWSALFNTLFDLVERRLAGRVASERPHRWRTVHATLHELTALVVSCPVIYAMTDLGWWGALLADLGLTVAYAAYAYVFHLAFDRLRPVGQAGRIPGALGRNGHQKP